MVVKVAGTKGSYEKIFGSSKISQEEEARLKELCSKIRKLGFQDISPNGLRKAHDILTGGTTLPAFVTDKPRYMWMELTSFVRNPPRVSSYVKKLEKVYTALKLK